MSNGSRNERINYYELSKQKRREALEIAEKYKNNPLEFEIHNGVDGIVQVTKSDIRTIIGKNTTDDKFNAKKNEFAKDLKSFIEKAEYMGYREVEDGKHKEADIFIYHKVVDGEDFYLCTRRLTENGIYKPYAIINKRYFDYNAKNIKK